MKFMVSVAIGLNRLSSLQTPLWYIALFTVSYSLLKILRIHDIEETEI